LCVISFHFVFSYSLMLFCKHKKLQFCTPSKELILQSKSRADIAINIKSWHCSLIVKSWYCSLIVKSWYCSLIVKSWYCSLIVKSWYCSLTVKSWYCSLTVKGWYSKSSSRVDTAVSVKGLLLWNHNDLTPPFVVVCLLRHSKHYF